LEKITFEDIAPHLVTITMRLRSLFDQESHDMKAAAISAFGQLSRFTDHQARDSLLEPFSSSLIPLLIYLNETDPQVVKACKFSLKRIWSFTGPSSLDQLCQKALLEENSLHYGEFLNTFTKLLVKEAPEKVDNHISTAVSYLKSEGITSQSNAIVLMGFLLGNQSPDQRNHRLEERATAALLVLLKESPCSDVRVRAAEALCLW
jgi:hypothetical protein